MEPFNMEKPRRLAPDLTPEQRAAMPPGDLLIKYVMPKLWDKVNFLEYDLKVEIISLQQRLRKIEEVNQRLLTIVHDGRPTPPEEEKTEKPKRGRRKTEKPKGTSTTVPGDNAAAKVDISTPVAMSSIARYDVESDTWQPKEFGGMKITSAVVQAIMSPDEETDGFPPEVVMFVYDLSEDARKLLCATFPDENQEESF